MRVGPAGGAALLGILVGCGGKLEPQEGVALEGFRYGWQGFNHRLSALEVGLGGDAAHVAVIGGTSTTGIDLPDLAEGCDPETCKEFPFTDTADVEVRWARLASSETALVAATVALEVGADGVVQDASVAAPKGAEGAVVAWVNGVHLSTDHALSGGESCYNPAYGWHPRRLEIALGDPALADDQLTVPVTARFEAGESLEAERACVDAVNEQAVVDLQVDVLFLVGEGDAGSVEITQTSTYEYDGVGLPDEQVEPAPVAADFGFVPTAVGWSSLDFVFHEGDPDNRGAYLRTIGFAADPVAGEATGTATNYSPGTQLSGFEYAFAGVLGGVAFPVTAERGTISAAVEAELDDAGAPVIVDLPY